MRIIELDATKWQSVLDFYNALLSAIGAPAWHGKNPNALVDSMIWGEINAVTPPYTIRISGTASLPKDVLDHIELVKRDLAKGRIDYHDRCGGDVEIFFEVPSKLDMRIYTAFDGIETTIRWRSEREFDAVKNYLKKIGASVMGISENNKRTDGVFVYVERNEQIEALSEFVKSFRQDSQA